MKIFVILALLLLPTKAFSQTIIYDRVTEEKTVVKNIQYDRGKHCWQTANKCYPLEDFAAFQNNNRMESGDPLQYKYDEMEMFQRDADKKLNCKIY